MNKLFLACIAFVVFLLGAFVFQIHVPLQSSSFVTTAQASCTAATFYECETGQTTACNSGSNTGWQTQVTRTSACGYTCDAKLGYTDCNNLNFGACDDNGVGRCIAQFTQTGTPKTANIVYTTTVGATTACGRSAHFANISTDSHVAVYCVCGQSGAGACTGSTITTQPTVPTTMVAGQTYPVSVTIKNTGAQAWTQATKYQLGFINPQANSTWGIPQVTLASSDDIINGASKTFTFNVKAPATAGTYNFQVQMNQNATTWFGAQSTNVAVSVTGPTGTPGPTATPTPTPTPPQGWTPTATPLCTNNNTVSAIQINWQGVTSAQTYTINFNGTDSSINGTNSYYTSDITAVSGQNGSVVLPNGSTTITANQNPSSYVPTIDDGGFIAIPWNFTVTANFSNGSTKTSLNVKATATKCSPTQSPTPTISNQTTGNLTLQFEGIGLDDNANPIHPKRQVILRFYAATDTSFQHALFTSSAGIVTYNSTNGYFTNGSFPLTGLSSGSYLILVTSPQGSLTSQIGSGDGTGPITITGGQPNMLVDTQNSQDPNAATTVPLLHMGNMYQQSSSANTVDILDWNIIKDCFGNTAAAMRDACLAHSGMIDPATSVFLPDMNDDGTVDGIDYTIVMKNFNHFGIGTAN